MTRSSATLVSNSTRKLDTVQALRAVAALLVLGGHCYGAVRRHPEAFGIVPNLVVGGGIGVDVFFLISGFIMVFTSRRLFATPLAWLDFMGRRLVRIVPLYWGMTLLTLVLMGIGHAGLPATSAIAASFAFFPFDTRGANDGFAFPIVDLGWTLNYEILFYVVFALFLFLPMRRCVAAVALTMLTLVIFGWATQPQLVALRFWSQPIIFEFVLGMGIAMAFLKQKPTWGLAARSLLVAVAVALYFIDWQGVRAFATTPNDMRRVLGWGMPSLLLLWAALAGPTKLDSVLGRIMVALGDASYALYLLHPLVLVALLRIATTGLFLRPGGAIAFAVTVLITASMFALTIHRLLERPVIVWLTGLLRKKGLPIGRVPLPPEGSRA